MNGEYDTIESLLDERDEAYENINSYMEYLGRRWRASWRSNGFK